MNNTYTTYLNNFNDAWANERRNEAPLNTLQAMFKLYLFKQIATDTPLSKSSINKYFIREVFKINGDIKKNPYKSCIYNKLTALNYLINKINYSTSSNLDVDTVIDNITDKVFKKYNNFYEILKDASKKHGAKDSTSGINKASVEDTAQEASVVNITNATQATQEASVDNMQLLDDLMNTTLRHLEICYIDSPAESLNKLIKFSSSVNQLINKLRYNKVA